MEEADIVSDKEQIVNPSPQDNELGCVQCGKICTTNAAMKNHVKHVHDKIRAHICEMCAKDFATGFDLNTHNIQAKNPIAVKNVEMHLLTQVLLRITRNSTKTTSQLLVRSVERISRSRRT